MCAAWPLLHARRIYKELADAIPLSLAAQGRAVKREYAHSIPNHAGVGYDALLHSSEIPRSLWLHWGLATKRRESADSMCGSKGNYALGYVALSALAAPHHPALAKCMKRMTDEWQQGKGTDGRHVSPPLVVDQH